jgi:hypothetical protein
MKNTKTKIILSAILGISALAGVSLRATPITVNETGIGSSDTAIVNSSALGSNLDVYAGIINLSLTQGAQTSNAMAFCIDPWHLSASGAQSYNIEALASGPKVEGPMGALAALQIQQLWAQYMTSSYALSGSASTADAWSAALQLEIWQTVAGSITTPGATYSLGSVANGYAGEAAAVTADQASMTAFLAANPNAAAANLVALTGATGQDYVVSAVPDHGTTTAFVLIGLLVVLAFCKTNSIAATIKICIP